MKDADDPTTRAVDELNRRLARTQRRMVTLTTVCAVVAGLACAVWTLISLEFDVFAFRIVIPAFLVAALATLAVGALLTRVVLGGLKGVWARHVASQEGANPDEVLSFALPFGGPPGGKGSGRVWAQGAAVTGGTAAVVVVLGLLIDWETALRVAATITGGVFTMGFWAYLGFRAPR